METMWGEVRGLLSLGLLLDGARVVLRIALILLLATLGKRVAFLFVDRLFQARVNERLLADEKRRRTLATLMKSVSRYGIDFVSLLAVLAVFDVPITSFLAAAGLASLAIGFGAQNLVRDVIGGFFILFEDQFAVGEHIAAAGVEGLVEEMGLRTTRIRDFGGEVHIIPNGLIDKVTNYSRGTMRVLVSVDIAYEENVDEAVTVLQGVCERMAAEMDVITEGPRVLGVHELTESGVTLLVWARAKPLEQWGVGRELRRRIKEAFDRAGIEIPYPRRVMVPARATKAGQAPEAEKPPAGPDISPSS